MDRPHRRLFHQMLHMSLNGTNTAFHISIHPFALLRRIPYRDLFLLTNLHDFLRQLSANIGIELIIHL